MGPLVLAVVAQPLVAEDFHFLDRESFDMKLWRSERERAQRFR